MFAAKSKWLQRACIEITLTLVVVFALAAAAKPTSVLYVSPMPDSKMVSAQTNIILRIVGTLDRSVAKDSSIIFVYGSLSGIHQGRLRISDDDETMVFLPVEPFTPGEIVSVRLRSGIQTREGFIVNPMMFSFWVSPMTAENRQAMSDQLESRIDVDDIYSRGKMDIATQLLKESAPKEAIPPGFPALKVVASNNPSPGDLFIGTFKILRSGAHFQFIQYAQSDKQYVMILDNNATPVFFKPTPGLNTDFKVQPNGHLTYYDDAVSAFRELDTNYNTLNMYSAGNGYKTDVHAFRILPNGHVIFLCQEMQTMDMSAFAKGGSPVATVIGMVIQEQDREKNVVFQWRTLDHFKITDATHEDLTEGIVDYVHSNTIEIDADGNILLSSRHMDEITKIDRNTGKIIWRWGGKNNQFTFINDTLHFFHQHSIRRTPGGTYILFDNGNFREPEFSRVVEYSLDEKAMTATQVWQYRHTPDIFSVAMSSVQRLPNGNTLIGWGTTPQPAITEVRPDGTVALEIQLPDSVVSYRAFKSVWPLPSIGTTVSKKSPMNLSYSLHQNYPNPFNPSTTIQFDLAEPSYVTLKVFDLLGRVVATLIDEQKPAGSYTVPFNASGASSGTYLAVLKATRHNQNGESVQTLTRKMVLNK